MSDDLPSRAASALAPGFPLSLASGKKILLQPFTPQRLLLLHSVECPLFYDEGRYGLPLAWAASMRIMAEPNAEALAYELALNGTAGFVADAFAWFGTFEPALAFEDLAAFAVALKAEWSRICDLDRADRPDGDGSAVGEACAPGTGSLPSSSAMPSTPGAGASGAPSTAPSASCCSAAAPSAANPSPATGAVSVGPN